MVDYVPFSWEETVYTEQQVIDQLNNMERQYSTFKGVVDTVDYVPFRQPGHPKPALVL